MRFKRISCMESAQVLFGFLSLSLAFLLLCSESWGQCTPGQRFDDSYVPDNIEQPWSGNKVPVSLLPPGFPGTGSYFYVFLIDRCGVPGFFGCGDWCFYEGGGLVCPYPGLWETWNGIDWRYDLCWNWNEYSGR